MGTPVFDGPIHRSPSWQQRQINHKTPSWSAARKIKSNANSNRPPTNGDHNNWVKLLGTAIFRTDYEAETTCPAITWRLRRRFEIIPNKIQSGINAQASSGKTTLRAGEESI
jgi:hypothetical protein